MTIYTWKKHFRYIGYRLVIDFGDTGIWKEIFKREAKE